MIQNAFLILFLSSCVKEYQTRNVIPYNTRKMINSTSELIFFDDKRSIELLKTSEYKDDFFRLAPFFEPQNYPSTCGPASLKMVIAALYKEEGRQFLEAKNRSRVGKFHGVNQKYYAMTEENIFDFVDKIPANKILDNGDYTNYKIIARIQKDSSGNFNGGTGAEHLLQIAQTHGFDGEIFFIENQQATLEEDLKLFKVRLKNTLLNKNSYMMAYFAQITNINGKSGGHFAVIGAYNEKEDMVLILDTYINANSWYWIKTEELVKAMLKEYNESFSRGYLIINKS